jgi:Cdc6-like AAA superfamily ATPase
MNVSHIIKAIQSSIKTNASLLRDLNLQSKLILLCFYLVSLNTKTHIFTDKIYQKYSEFCAEHSIYFKAISKSEFLDVVMNLEMAGVWTLKDFNRGFSNINATKKIQSNITPEEFKEYFLADKLFSNFVKHE